MSIPLNNLYHYIENIAEEIYGNSVIIYRFWPHGSKNLVNRMQLKEYDWVSDMISPHIVCNDQEPLNFDFYENYSSDSDLWMQMLEKYSCYEHTNLKPTNIFDRSILLHSEQRSDEVIKYQKQNFIPVYYWSHALISLDWFRFAQHLTQKKKIKKTFLIYNRAWAGIREYRIKFSELIQNYDLLKYCQMTFNETDPDSQIHYKNHVFKNKIWRPNTNFSQYFNSSQASSTDSATLNLNDYENTEIEIVLETLFDDSRLHFTEKILRPISIAQPFILVGGYQGLKYLKSYGFKTFESVWDESYDNIKDPSLRLNAIIELIKTISHWDSETKAKKLEQAKSIADYNKKLFFSKTFFNFIKSELITNLSQGIKTMIDTNTSAKFLQSRIKQSKYIELKNILTGKVPNPRLKNFHAKHPYQSTYMTPESTVKILSSARKYYLHSLSQDSKKQ